MSLPTLPASFGYNDSTRGGGTGRLNLSGFDLVERAFSGRNGGMAATCSGNWHAAEQFFLIGASAINAMAGFKSLVAGLKADAAFARWKQGRYADALLLYTEVLELLEDIPTEENSQTHHVHAAVRHCLGWIDRSTRDGSERGLADPAPGICSNPEPIAGLKDRSLIDMAAVWGTLGHIDTRLGTGLGLMRKAEQKSNGALPLNVRCGERLARYQALWNGTDLVKAVSLIIGMIEGSMCLKELKAANLDGLAPGDIIPLRDDYWDNQDNRAYLLSALVAVSVLATYLHPDSPLPVEAWVKDMHLHNIAGPEVGRFFSLLTGIEKQADGSLPEEAALALCRIREGMLLPKDLFICHLRLLTALFSEEWGKSVGDALAKIVSAQWLNVSENQRFALTNPSLYAPLLKEKCESIGRDGFSKVASILQTAVVAGGLRLDDSVIEFLSRVEHGEGNASSTA